MRATINYVFGPWLLLVAMSGPAQATCLQRGEDVLPDVQVTLTSPKGKTLTRMTGADGMLTLKGLRKGEWQVQLTGQQNAIPMIVANDKRLVIKSVAMHYSCSPPGGPVSHGTTKRIVHVNRVTK